MADWLTCLTWHAIFFADWCFLTKLSCSHAIGQANYIIIKATSWPSDCHVDLMTDWGPNLTPFFCDWCCAIHVTGLADHRLSANWFTCMLIGWLTFRLDTHLLFADIRWLTIICHVRMSGLANCIAILLTDWLVEWLACEVADGYLGFLTRHSILFSDWCTWLNNLSCSCGHRSRLCHSLANWLMGQGTLLLTGRLTN